jgi:hypothetical protein
MASYGADCGRSGGGSCRAASHPPEPFSRSKPNGGCPPILLKNSRSWSLSATSESATAVPRSFVAWSVGATKSICRSFVGPGFSQQYPPNTVLRPANLGKQISTPTRSSAHGIGRTRAAFQSSYRTCLLATTGCWSSSPTLTTTSLTTVSSNSRFPTSASGRSRRRLPRVWAKCAFHRHLRSHTHRSDSYAASSDAAVPTKFGSRIIPRVQVADPGCLHHLSGSTS